jgi:hypothetical protein
MTGVLLSACAPATIPAAPFTSATAQASIAPEMIQRLTRIPSFITLKAGDAVPAFAPVAVNMPDGETKQLDLKGMLNGRRALIYFYVLDDTPL